MGEAGRAESSLLPDGSVRAEGGMKMKVGVERADGTGFQKGEGPGGEVGSEDKWS